MKLALIQIEVEVGDDGVPTLSTTVDLLRGAAESLRALGGKYGVEYLHGCADLAREILPELRRRHEMSCPHCSHRGEELKN